MRIHDAKCWFIVGGTWVSREHVPITCIRDSHRLYLVFWRLPHGKSAKNGTATTLRHELGWPLNMQFLMEAPSDMQHATFR